MDEAEIAKQKYINLLVGSLDAPNQTFLVDCYPLESGSYVNSSFILHSVDDILRQLELKRENFSLLTDAARCMSLALKTLKGLYPWYISTALRTYCITVLCVCVLILNIDKVITTIKTVTIKHKICKKDFHDAALPSPLDSAITRWATRHIELSYITVRTFQLFVPLLTIGQVQVSESAEQKTLSMWKIWCRTWLKQINI